MPSIYLNNVKYGGSGTNGKNVVVAKIEPIVGGNRVTFSYYDDLNVQKSSFIEVMNGEQGVSIASAKIETGNKLILNLSDGTTIDAGVIAVDSSSLSLDNYYTKEQSDNTFVPKLELNTLIEDYLNENLEPISNDEIQDLF